MPSRPTFASTKPAAKRHHFCWCQVSLQKRVYGIYPTPRLATKWNDKAAKQPVHTCVFSTVYGGAQWLSGRVLDSKPRGRGFEPHRRHCVVSLSKTNNPSLVLGQPKKTRSFITERLLMGRKESKKQTTVYGIL